MFIVKLKKGAFVVSVSYAIPHKEFEMCDYCEYEMNFGLANVFIQQKTTDPHDYVEPVEIEEEEDEDGGTSRVTKTINKPAYWNGVKPSTAMTAEECTLTRGAERNTAYPFAQQSRRCAKRRHHTRSTT